MLSNGISEDRLGFGTSWPARQMSRRSVRRARSGRLAAAALACAFISSTSLPVAAVERLHRVYDHNDGLPTDTVTDIAQDAAGFLWIATPGGLVRFDGDEMRRWDEGGRAFERVAASPRGPIVALDDGGRLWEVRPNGGLEPLAGLDGAPIADARDAVYDPSGTLWIVRAAEVVRRAPDGRWTRYAARDAFEGETVRALRADSAGRALILTLEAVWTVGADARPDRIVALPAPTDVIRRDDGALIVAAGDTTWIVEEALLTPYFQIAARPIALAERHGSLWASFDRYLVRLRDGQAPAVIGPEDGLPAGGRLLVDREGNLWVCTFRGLLQFPEPDTVMWSERDGLPSSHARFLGRSPAGLWISTWGGLAQLESASGRPVALEGGAAHQGDVCLDAAGGLWHTGDHLTERRGARSTIHEGYRGYLRFCTPSNDGRIWLGVGRQLVRAGPAGVEPMSGPPGVKENGVIAPLLEDRSGRLWVGVDRTLCHARLADEARAAWTCEVLPARVEPASMIEVGDTLWLATNGDGVFRRQEDAWTQIPASASLGGGRMFKLRPAADGSVWVLSLGMPTRVVDRPSSPDGWEVVEAISAWHGQPSGGASDLIEEPDGTIWTATAAGLVRVAGRSRRAPLAAPTVQLAGLFVDGRSADVDRPLRLSHRTNLVEMRFAALTYRDRPRLRYQARMSSDEGWVDLTTGGPVFRFPNLPAGEYVADVRASLDGRTWSADGERVAFRVSGPWYLQPWLLALVASAIAVLLLAVHRARLRLALRWEPKRTEIAMDLHDEIGSGLGSIGILAGIAGAPDRRDVDRGLLREIANTAGDLSTSLGDIVWSLRSGGRTLQELADRIAERGHRLFPDGSAGFVLRMPDALAAERLSLPVQRNVLLIAVEALHNAARHAGARHVVVDLSSAGDRWRIGVADDGRGFDARAGGEASGLGLRSMRRRAAQIGAELTIESSTESGTTVCLVFDPRAGDERPGRMTMRGPDEGTPAP